MQKVAIVWVLFAVEFICSGGPLDHWAWCYPLPPGDNVAAIASGNGQLVAVGEHGNIITSSDGTNWVSRQVGTDIDFKSIAYGNSLFVAVGWETVDSDDYGAIFISTNAVNWTQINSGVIWGLWGLQGVAYGNGDFVAVGLGGVIISSSDGVNWDQSNDSSDCCSDLEAVCYGNGLFAVAQGGGSILISSNGTHWVEYYSGTAYGFWSIVAGNGLYVASGSYGIILTSTNGIDWSNFGASYPFRCIGFGNGWFIANDGEVSTDGVNWAPGSATVDGWILGAVWDNGIYVAVGSPPSPLFSVSGASAFTSLDGTEWNSANSAAYNTLTKVVYARDQFIAVGANGSILTSSNGSAWTQQISGIAGNLSAVTCGNNQIVAVGDDATILTSRDAINWTQATNVPSAIGNPAILGITYGKHLFVAVGNYGTILTSQDGTNWIQQNSGVANSLFSVTHGRNNCFVAVGDNGTILTSQNGTNWNQTTSITDDKLSDVAYGNGEYVAVGNNYDNYGSDIFASPDGKNWTPLYELGLWLHGISYGNGQFVTVGEGFDDAVEIAPIYSSPNGVNWSSHFSGTTGDLFCVAYGNGVFVAVGEFILESQPIVRLGPLARLPDGSMQIKIEGEAGVTNHIQVSTDLLNWMELTNMVLTNSTGRLLDPDAAQFDHRFYRNLILE